MYVDPLRSFSKSENKTWSSQNKPRKPRMIRARKAKKPKTAKQRQAEREQYREIRANAAETRGYVSEARRWYSILR